MLKAVLFDLDGTIFDSTQAIVDSMNYVFDTIGEPRPPREKVVAGIGHPLREELPLLTKHDPDECARIYRAYYLETAAPKTKLLPGARAALEMLRDAGLRLGCGTSRLRESMNLILGHLGVADFFEMSVTAEDVTRSKPDPETVLKALAHFGLETDEMAFVGDMHFDVLAGKGAGVRTIAVTTGYETREELEALGPEAVFDGVEAAARYLLNT